MKERDKLPFRMNCEGYFFDKSKNVLAKEINGVLIFPGGGVDNNEHIEKAIIRETFEETRAIIKNLRKVGKLKFIWDKNWAKTEKQKRRYQKYKGEYMHFFVGEVIKFENLDSAKKGEDFWHGEKLIPISKAIEIIESGRPFDNEIKEYRESQLKFLRRIQDGYKKRRL